MKKISTVVAVSAAFSLAGLGTAFADGKALYDQNCKKCHGADLKGNAMITKMMKPEKAETMDLTGASVKGMDEAAIAKAITNGSRKMKPVKVTPADATEIAKFVKSQQK